MKHHLAQYNIARLRAPLDDPLLADFMAALDPLNRLADESEGFVWRHQADDGNSTSIRVRGDPMILINFSVWEDLDSLFQYTYYSDHTAIFRRRQEFFQHIEGAYLVLWWVRRDTSHPSKRQRTVWTTSGSTGRPGTRSASRVASRRRPAEARGRRPDIHDTRRRSSIPLSDEVPYLRICGRAVFDT